MVVMAMLAGRLAALFSLFAWKRHLEAACLGFRPANILFAAVDIMVSVWAFAMMDLFT